MGKGKGCEEGYEVINASSKAFSISSTWIASAGVLWHEQPYGQCVLNNLSLTQWPEMLPRFFAA
jgi:hypothetical protein